MEGLTYKDINQVVTSWELARQKHGNEEALGMAILLRLFDLEPESKKIFNLGADIKMNGILQMAVLIHGHRMVHMIDSFLSLLGPDTETLQEILVQLGERHRRYGVKAEYIPLLGQSIRESLEVTIGQEWTEAMNAAWIQVYTAMSSVLVQVLK